MDKPNSTPPPPPPLHFFQKAKVANSLLNRADKCKYASGVACLLHLEQKRVDLLLEHLLHVNKVRLQLLQLLVFLPVHLQQAVVPVVCKRNTGHSVKENTSLSKRMEAATARAHTHSHEHTNTRTHKHTNTLTRTHTHTPTHESVGRLVFNCCCRAHRTMRSSWSRCSFIQSMSCPSSSKSAVALTAEPNACCGESLLFPRALSCANVAASRCRTDSSSICTDCFFVSLSCSCEPAHTHTHEARATHATHA